MSLPFGITNTLISPTSNPSRSVYYASDFGNVYRRLEKVQQDADAQGFSLFAPLGDIFHLIEGHARDAEAWNLYLQKYMVICTRDTIRRIDKPYFVQDKDYFTDYLGRSLTSTPYLSLPKPIPMPLPHPFFCDRPPLPHPLTSNEDLFEQGLFGQPVVSMGVPRLKDIMMLFLGLRKTSLNINKHRSGDHLCELPHLSTYTPIASVFPSLPYGKHFFGCPQCDITQTTLMGVHRLGQVGQSSVGTYGLDAKHVENGITQMIRGLTQDQVTLYCFQVVAFATESGTSFERDESSMQKFLTNQSRSSDWDKPMFDYLRPGVTARLGDTTDSRRNYLLGELAKLDSKKRKRESSTVTPVKRAPTYTRSPSLSFHGSATHVPDSASRSSTANFIQGSIQAATTISGDDEGDDEGEDEIEEFEEEDELEEDEEYEDELEEFEEEDELEEDEDEDEGSLAEWRVDGDVEDGPYIPSEDEYEEEEVAGPSKWKGKGRA